MEVINQLFSHSKLHLPVVCVQVVFNVIYWPLINLGLGSFKYGIKWAFPTFKCAIGNREAPESSKILEKNERINYLPCFTSRRERRGLFWAANFVFWLKNKMFCHFSTYIITNWFNYHIGINALFEFLLIRLNNVLSQNLVVGKKKCEWKNYLHDLRISNKNQRACVVWAL